MVNFKDVLHVRPVNASYVISGQTTFWSSFVLNCLSNLRYETFMTTFSVCIIVACNVDSFSFQDIFYLSSRRRQANQNGRLLTRHFTVVELLEELFPSG